LYDNNLRGRKPDSYKTQLDNHCTQLVHLSMFTALSLSFLQTVELICNTSRWEACLMQFVGLSEAVNVSTHGIVLQW